MKLNYTLDSINQEEIMNTIYDAYVESGKSNFLVVNIGTDAVLGDMFAPLVGTMLNEKCLNVIDVIGTLDAPVMALNIPESIRLIENDYSDAFVLALDAVISYPNSYIVDFEKGINPAKGVGKDFPNIGNMSIKFATTDDAYQLFGDNVRCRHVYKAAKITRDIICAIDAKISLKNDH